MSWADHAGDPLPDGHPERFAARPTHWRRQPWRAPLTTLVAVVVGLATPASAPEAGRRESAGDAGLPPGS
jgi:hypothetical protein